jgi:purine-binding chemotaxis protein CheW
MPRQRHDPTKNLVGFLVGDVAYAVRIETVREIVNPLDIIELPRAPISVRGVASFRGEVVPVIDLRVRFALDASRSSRRNKWIIIDVAPKPKIIPHEPTPPPTIGRYVALVVDSVTEVFGTGGEAIRPAPALGTGDDLRGIEGVASYGGGLVFVLDVRAFNAVADAALREVPPSSASPFGGS